MHSAEYAAELKLHVVRNVDAREQANPFCCVRHR